MNVKIGDKIRILHMDGEQHYAGKEGTVDHIDDIGQLHGSWADVLLFQDLIYTR